MIKFIDILKESLKKDILFIKPNFEKEWGEAKRYPEIFKDKEQWIKIAPTGKEQNVDCSMNIQNTDMCENNLEDLHPDKVARAKKAIKKGSIELPIVLKIGNKYELLAGNTRITALKKYGYPTKAWVIDTNKIN